MAKVKSFWKTLSAIIITIAAIATTVGVIYNIWQSPPPPSPKPAGRILNPKSGQVVGRSILVDGTLKNIPSGHHIWLFVQTGNLMFPKEPEIPANDQHWSQEIVEGGNPQGGKFSLVLVMVTSKTNKTINDWIENLLKGKNPKAMTKIPGSKRLDSVQNLILK